MKYFSMLLCLLAVGCATPVPKTQTPAVTFDHENKELRKSFNNMSAEELEAKVGAPLIKGYDALEGQEPGTLYRLVYVQANQAPTMIENLKENMAKNQETGVKCMSFNFSKRFKYKFKSSIAPLSWDQDCNNFRDIKEVKEVETTTETAASAPKA